MTKKRLLILLAVGALALLPAAAGAATTERVSVDDSEAQATDGNSVNPAISADGRFVAFQSSATNLVAGDGNGQWDIFVRDRTLGTTERVSVDSTETEAAGGSSFSAAISADGRFVAFHSLATNLVASDSNGQWDVFVRDRTLGTTERASVDSGGAQAIDGISLSPTISADGRYVAFWSDALNLDAGDSNGKADIFVRDLNLDTTERVNVDSAEAQAADGHSFRPAISADGRFVTFESAATNLVASDSNGQLDIFVRDRTLGTTERVNVDSAEVQAVAGDSGSPGISADGQFVTFYSDAPNLVGSDTNSFSDVFVRDRSLGTTERVSRDSAGAQATGGESNDPAISADGRFVAFYSRATNLVAGDSNSVADVFVRDRVDGYTVRASVAEDGTQALGGGSGGPAMSVGGEVAFESQAINLTPGDTNFRDDVFVRVADGDDDKVLEPHDNCPAVANLDQSDSDSDGAGNACDDDDDSDNLPDSRDSCPLLAEDFDGFVDADGCPDTDNDLDGVLDVSDTGKVCFDPAATLSCGTIDCRNIAEDYDAFKDTDGCPEPDNDNDSFPDATDQCPGTGSQAGVDGMLGSPQDTNHNGIQDGAETTLTTDDPLTYAFEDRDGVLDTDGCHDSPGEDFDGDGYDDDDEALKIGTNAGYPCGGNGWPSDLVSTGGSANKLDIFDLVSFVAPVRLLDKSPGPGSPYNARWDLAPGPNSPFPNFISIYDITTMLSGVSGSPAYPPMLGGARAFGKTCPLAP